MLGYLCIALTVRVVCWVLRRPLAQFNTFGKVYDASTFAWSVMLIGSIIDPKLLSLIGDVKAFLMTAGLCGIIYTVRQLFSP